MRKHLLLEGVRGRVLLTEASARLPKPTNQESARRDAEKFERVQQLNEAVLSLAAARIRREHPGIGERELRLRLASLWLDSATMKRAFGWDPDAADP